MNKDRTHTDESEYVGGVGVSRDTDMMNKATGNQYDDKTSLYFKHTLISIVRHESSGMQCDDPVQGGGGRRRRRQLL